MSNSCIISSNSCQEFNLDCAASRYNIGGIQVSYHCTVWQGLWPIMLIWQLYDIPSWWWCANHDLQSPCSCKPRPVLWLGFVSALVRLCAHLVVVSWGWQGKAWWLLGMLLGRRCCVIFPMVALQGQVCFAWHYWSIKVQLHGLFQILSILSRVGIAFSLIFVQGTGSISKLYWRALNCSRQDTDVCRGLQCMSLREKRWSTQRKYLGFEYYVNWRS